MALARHRSMWNHTSHMMALIANCHRDPKRGKTFAPSDFNPYHEKTPAEKRKAEAIPADVSALKAAFSPQHVQVVKASEVRVVAKNKKG